MANGDVVAVGESLGRLEALCGLVAALSDDFPAALLAVLHTAPESPCLLAEIVGRYTSLRVRYGGDGDRIQNGHLFIAQPGRHMIVRDLRHFGSDYGPKVQFGRPAIDKLFESVATVFGKGAIGVVLSGGGRDGPNGLGAITAAGGVGIVQNPLDARVTQMPAGAIESGHPEFVLPVSQIALLLPHLVQEEVDSSRPATL
jgi:two-component system chemotaxis response regulator CheB